MTVGTAVTIVAEVTIIAVVTLMAVVTALLVKNNWDSSDTKGWVRKNKADHKMK